MNICHSHPVKIYAICRPELWKHVMTPYWVITVESSERRTSIRSLTKTDLEFSYVMRSRGKMCAEWYYSHTHTTYIPERINYDRNNSDVYFKYFSFSHPAWRALTSHWSMRRRRSALMVVYEKPFLVTSALNRESCLNFKKKFSQRTIIKLFVGQSEVSVLAKYKYLTIENNKISHCS